MGDGVGIVRDIFIAFTKKDVEVWSQDQDCRIARRISAWTGT